MIISFTGSKNSGKNTAASMINFIANDYTFEDWNQPHNVIYQQFDDGGDQFRLRLQQLKYEDYEYTSRKDIINLLNGGLDNQFKLLNLELPIFFEEKSFASKVKDVCAIITGLPRKNFDNRELRNCELGIDGLNNPYVNVLSENKEVYNSYYKDIIPNYTYRTLMQRVGTEAMRDMIHEDVWVNALLQDYKPIDLENRSSMGNVLDYSNCKWPNWLITDLRFDNEARAVVERNGYIIQLDRNSNQVDNHASEQLISPILVNWFVGNNGTLEKLYNKLQQVYKLIQHDRKN